MTSWRVCVRAHVGALELDVALEGHGAPLALVGPNASGKTSLLRIIAGVITPQDGDIEVGGTTLFSRRRGVDLSPEQRRVGYVPQGYGLFPHLRVLDNVAFGLSVGQRRQSRAARRQAARAMLEQLGCAELAERLPPRLSGGEQQRVALARALVIQPAMLLLDEPLAALDPGRRRAVRTFLAQRLRALGRPAIVVTHDARDIAALGAHVCVLERGRVVQQGDLEQLRSAPVNEFVAELVGASDHAPSATWDVRSR